MTSFYPFSILGICLLVAITMLSGCTNVTIDGYSTNDRIANITQGDTIVVLGRRHSSDYETEPSLVSCIGAVLDNHSSNTQIIEEPAFINALYPWFEPRTAPMSLRRLNALMQHPPIAEAMNRYNIRYMIWVDGSTQTTNSTGSIACTVGAGGAGCFGFGTWDKESDYEASIWDFKDRTLLGKVSADASGTSYMPAVVIPIPMIARVQATACQGMGGQLKEMLLK